MNKSTLMRLNNFGLQPKDLDVITQHRGALEAMIPDIVESFYQEMMQHAELREIIAESTTTDRLRQTFKGYLQRLFSGEIDQTYDDERIRIGQTHHHVGLSLKWYLEMFSFLETKILMSLYPSYAESSVGDWIKIQSAISGLMKYDQLLAVDAYLKAHTRELRMQTKTAEQARQAKSLFLAKVSHELRTPLSSIIGYTDLILDTAKEITPGTRQHLSVLHRNASNLLSMINGLIEIGQADSGKWATEESRARLDDLLEDMAINAEGLLTGKPVVVHRAYRTKGPLTTNMDFSKLRQILLNLVSNACKFTDSGYVAIDYEVDEKTIKISISDSGPGIDESFRHRVFEEFFRAPTAGQKKPGNGLGLSLVKTLVESMHGTIEVANETPQGLKIQVFFPKNDA